MFDCKIISLLVVGIAMLMLASATKVPKLVSRRDLRTMGTLVLAAGAVMIVTGVCSGRNVAKYSLSPAPIDAEGASSVDRSISEALLDTAKVSLECCDTSPYSTSTGCVCGAQEFVKSQECQEGTVAGQFSA